jgi:hypothetical protein
MPRLALSMERAHAAVPKPPLGPVPRSPQRYGCGDEKGLIKRSKVTLAPPNININFSHLLIRKLRRGPHQNFHRPKQAESNYICPIACLGGRCYEATDCSQAGSSSRENSGRAVRSSITRPSRSRRRKRPIGAVFQVRHDAGAAGFSHGRGLDSSSRRCDYFRARGDCTLGAGPGVALAAVGCGRPKSHRI